MDLNFLRGDKEAFHIARPPPRCSMVASVLFVVQNPKKTYHTNKRCPKQQKM